MYVSCKKRKEKWSVDLAKFITCKNIGVIYRIFDFSKFGFQNLTYRNHFEFSLLRNRKWDIKAGFYVRLWKPKPTLRKIESKYKKRILIFVLGNHLHSFNTFQNILFHLNNFFKYFKQTFIFSFSQRFHNFQSFTINAKSIL